jgi:tRNA dimethylallyltransferase
VVADSRQVYQRLEIATNKPLPEERARVRYHGLDLAPPEASFNVFEYVQAASAAVDSIERPIVEGGSNLYVDALLDGLSLGGVAPRPERRRELEGRSTDDLAEAVRRLDPEASLDFQNRVRLVRAIEVLEVSGPPLSRLRTRRPPPWSAVRIGLEMPRELLFARIAERCLRQLERGLIEETRAALEAGVEPGSQALTGTGYAETVAFLQGRISRDELPDLMARNNRRLAKRQLTWLRRDERIRWFSTVENPLPAILRYLDE